MAESQSCTLCDLLGISKSDALSENELNWWLARATKRPFLADQINILGAYEGKRKHVDWFYKPPLEDPVYVKAAKQRIKDIKETLNVENS